MQHDDKASMEGPAPADSMPGRGSTVLVAEDEPTIQHVITLAFEQEGYSVVTTDDGQDALERFQADGDRIDAIVLDMNMPRMDGECCLDELARLGCRVPVVLVTGDLLSSERQKHLLAHAAEIVMKPFDMKALLGTVSEALAQARRNRDKP